MIVDTLEDLASLASLPPSSAENQDDAAATSAAASAATAATWEVCQFWGELGLRCLCTSDERTREVRKGGIVERERAVD